MMSILICYLIFSIRFYLCFSSSENQRKMLSVISSGDIFSDIVSKFLTFRLRYRLKEKQQWKNDICLVIRSYKGDFDILNNTFLSTKLFWSEYIGEKSIIFDEGEEYLNQSFQGSGWRFFTETMEYPLNKSQGYLVKQWSNYYPEKYCHHSTYAAISDSDAIFSTYVTPSLLFNETGFPLVQLSKNFQKNLWNDDLKILKVLSKFNGMIRLPFLIKIDHLIECRNYICSIHNSSLAHILAKYPHCSQMCIFATFLYHFHKNDYHFVFNEEDEPIMQYGIHLPYSTMKARKHTPGFHDKSKILMMNGICTIPNFEHLQCRSRKNISYPYYWKYDALVWQHHETYGAFKNYIAHLNTIFN
ncbi:hypothetical protein TRFO_30649 [Tritrichomonas foetus]|uniref:Uncharacterized protein n=1 Tax=Tritrichomonas foetus TaxID=1144522 RepID=A0A1J4JXI6_9EUKA|nr:hypothetical protein TRFO_30649 [Tritrichomonas foetus]|eukprot:OHT02246.1 hypothetical protein TRFO_30649 [Tritrichomonas foetus]